MQNVSEYMPVLALCLVPFLDDTLTNKNSSVDEIANVNVFTTTSYM